MLICHNLTCKRGEKTVFRHLGFTIGKQTAMVITGPNGSGKTSLLRTIAGLTTPAEGSVSWDEEAIPGDALIYVGHKNALKLELTVEDNILLWSRLRDTPELFEAALYYFQLHDKRDLPCHILSAGWQKRVALAKILACHAHIWILDEPMANLDEDGKRLMLNLINSKVSQGGTVLLSTHAPLPLNDMCELDLCDFQLSVIASES